MSQRLKWNGIMDKSHMEACTPTRSADELPVLPESSGAWRGGAKKTSSTQRKWAVPCHQCEHLLPRSIAQHKRCVTRCVLPSLIAAFARV